MANYPAPPNHRLAYDLDGTRVFRWQVSNSLGPELTPAEVAAVQNESVSGWDGGSYSDTRGLVFLFPEPRTITHVYGANGGVYAESLGLLGSADTTNGLDGVWQSMGTLSPSSVDLSVPATYRTHTYSCSPNRTVRGLRLSAYAYAGMALRAIHIYGTPSAPSYGLAFRHASTDTALGASFWDWEDSASGTTATKQFRVKNFSADYKANEVSLGLSILTDSTPGVLGSFQFSLDGSTWVSTANLGDLEPGDFSSVVTLRRSLPSDSPLGLRAPRVRAAAATWEVA
jgi:hypothetical protein